MRNLLTFALKAAISGILLYFAFAHVNFDLDRSAARSPSICLAGGGRIDHHRADELVALRWQRIVEACNEPDAPPFTILEVAPLHFHRSVFQSNAAIDRRRRRSSNMAAGARQWRLAERNLFRPHRSPDRRAGLGAPGDPLPAVVVRAHWQSRRPHRFADRRFRQHRCLFGIFGAGICPLALAGSLVADAPAGCGRLECARRVFGSASSGAPIIAYSLIIHVMSVTAAWCLAKSVAAPLEWSQALLLVLPVLLIATIPLSIAGWGTRETAMILAFGYAGLPESDGLIVSVLFGIATVRRRPPGWRHLDPGSRQTLFARPVRPAR